MANKPLKSIQFPGLTDTYTVPVVDNTLAVTGAAADAKKVGDELTDLKGDISQLQGGSWTEEMANLFDQIGDHIAFTSANGGTLWTALVDTIKDLLPPPVLYQLKDHIFDGSSDQVIHTGLMLGSNTANGATNDWTLTCCAKSTATGNAWYGRAFSGGAPLRFADEPSSIITVLNENVSVNSALRNAYVPVVITHKANIVDELTVYAIINGEVTETKVTTTTNVNKLNMSRYTEILVGGGASDYYFKGHVKDFTIYEKILSKSDIDKYFSEVMS